MRTDIPHYLAVLEKTFSDRIQMNKQFSLRDFAKTLNLNPGELSRLLSQKQKPSINLGIKICSHLELAPTEKREFLLSIIEERTNLMVLKIEEATSKSK